MKKSILKNKYFDFMAQEWQNWVEISKFYVSTIARNWLTTFVYVWKFLQKIKILQLFFVKWYFLRTWVDQTIFLFEWMTETKLLIYFSLPSFEHILVLYTPNMSEIFYNQCFALADTWSSKQAKPIYERSHLHEWQKWIESYQ